MFWVFVSDDREAVKLRPWLAPSAHTPYGASECLVLVYVGFHSWVWGWGMFQTGRLPVPLTHDCFSRGAKYI